MYRWLLAWRWLRTLPVLWISVVGVCVGVASILVVDSIFNGVLRDLRRVARGTSSDLVIPLPPAPGSFTSSVAAVVRSCEGVTGIARRLRRPCLLPPGMRLPEVFAIGVISRRSCLELQGIDPPDEAAVTDLQRYLQRPRADRRVRDVARPFDLEGIALPPGPAPIPLLLGEQCADALGVERGAVFELHSVASIDESEAQEQGVAEIAARFVVVGTFQTDFYLGDLTRAYVPREALRTFTRAHEEASELAVRVADGASLVAVQERIGAAIRGHHPDPRIVLPVLTWERLERRTLQAIDEQRKVLVFILFIVVIVAGFNLLVSLNLLVTEKIRDIGTLAAMGGSAMGIASIFTALGLLVTGLGAGSGLLLGGWLARHVNQVHDLIARFTGRRLWDEDVYLFREIPVDFEPGVIAGSVAGTFAVTLLVAFCASLRAARLDPIEALRQE